MPRDKIKLSSGMK